MRVYQIRYKDPMTGTILEVQAHSLNDAVTSIQKAKDDLYYRGHSLQKDEVPSQELLSEESSSADQIAPPDEDDSSEDKDSTEDDDQDLDDFLYPYGVTLW
jgi:hypothetical protein